jgi:DNA repair exonuclease SbcCD ATPase subunit
MDSRNEDDAGDGAGNPAADAESLPLPVNEDDAGQENHTLSKEEGDAAGSDDDGQDANDVQMQQAEQRQPLDQLDDGNERAEITADGNLADGNLADMNAAEMGADGNLADTSPTEMNAADVNLGNDTAKSLQEEVNELKIDLLSSHRNLDEAHERELQLQNQLDELSRQLSVQARASADKISRLENRVAELQHQLEDASRLQQPSPASDLRIRAAEVQELKARIKQYEIKLASSEEISSIRKEAEMERVRTDASWQHRMLSDQVTDPEVKIFRVISQLFLTPDISSYRKSWSAGVRK